MTDTVPPETPVRRLTRSSHDRVIAGVCGGLADYTGIDPIVFRIGFVVAALAGGAGLAGYVLAWVFIPEEGDESPIVSRDRRTRPQLALLGILALCLLPLLTAVFAIRGDGWILIPLFFAVPPIIYAIRGERWGGYDHRRYWNGPVPPPPVTAPVPPAPGGGAEEWRHHRRPRSRLWLLTMSAGLVVGGVLASIEASGAADLSAATVFPILLLVVAAGLIVGAWYGHARRLIVLGVFLSLGAVSASTADVRIGGGVGDRTWQPTSASTLARRYSLGMGQATLDLRRIVDLRGTRHVKASVGVGELRVLIPADIDVDVTASVGIGNAELPGRPSDDGVGQDATAFYDAPGTDLLVLDLHIGIGHVVVDQGSRLFDGSFDLDNGFGPEVVR